MIVSRNGMKIRGGKMPPPTKVFLDRKKEAKKKACRKSNKRNWGDGQKILN